MTLLRDFRTLVYLFVALRVVLLITFQPELLEVADPQNPSIERGLTTLGDFAEHYQFATQITADHLPYRDYWVEFPPVWIVLAAGLAQITTSFTMWASWLYLILLVFEVGNLTLIRRLGTALHDDETGLGLAWVYALLASPLVMLGWNFEGLVLFSLLGSFYYSLGVGAHRNAPLRNAPLLAFGILTKYIPALLLPTIWKFAPRRDAIFYTLMTVILVGIVLIPLILWGGEMAIQSLTIQFDKPSYQTVWALLDGNYGTGSFPTGAVRADSNWSFVGGQARLIAPLRVIPFAAVGFWLFFLPIPPTPKHQWAFLTVTITLFMLWSQGWSPQWTVILIPLILLNYPTRLGVLVSLAVIVGAFMEYPLLFRQGGESWIPSENRGIFSLLILFRTGVLITITGTLIQSFRKASHELTQPSATNG